MAIITISRQSGSLGDELSRYLADKLGCKVITREYALENFFGELNEGTVNRLNESAKFFLSPMKGSDLTYKECLVSKLLSTAEELKPDENLIIVGLGGCVIFKDNPKALNIRVFSSEGTRINRIAKHLNITSEAASRTLEIGDRKHKKFVSTLFERDLNDSDLYDLSVNTDRMTVDEAASAVISFVSARNLRNRITAETINTEVSDHQTENIVFKNQTEEEFARILDMYNIKWNYEPKTFPIEWDAEGNIKMAFSPDFYLPKYDTYLELTVMDQRYVTKKNKKLRKVKELYPGTNIRIVYKKDFTELCARLNMLGGDNNKE